jgi:recombination protein RecA
VAPPFKEAEFDILYGVGISRDGEIVDLGSETGIVEKSGAWYSYGSERIGQGREAAKQFLRDHPETAKEIMAKVMEKTGVNRAVPDSAAAAAPAPAADKKEKVKGR